MTGISVKRELNSNTIIMVCGFVTSLVSLVLLWSDSQHNIADSVKRLDAHDTMFKAMSERFDAIDKRDADTRELQFKVGALQKADELMDDRITRITESYGNKFTEIGVSLSSIITQQALTNQALQRLEALAKPLPVQP